MNKTVIISGVTGGIGYESAVHLASIRYNIVGLYHSDDKNAEMLCTKLNDYNIEYKLYKCDVSDYNELSEISKDVLKIFDNIYAVVNNAGVALTKLFHEVTNEEYDCIMNTNVKGCFNLTKAFLPTLIHNKNGRIINISSMWGITGGSCEVVYSASKAAIIGMTKALAKEVGLSGIQVNAIAPGVIDTKMISNLSSSEKTELANDTPLQRLGTPCDIAKALEFLLSDNSSFITGQVLSVDGGMII